MAAQYCEKHGVRVTISNNMTEIGEEVFSGCPNLTVICSPDSYAGKYCEGKGIPVRSAPPDQNNILVEPEPSDNLVTPAQNKASQDTDKTPSNTTDVNQTKPARTGFFARLFGKK